MSNTSFMKIFLKDSEVEWMALWQVTTWDKRFNAVAKEKQPKVINYQYLLAAELFDLEQDNGDIFLLSTGERTGWTTKELAGKYLHEGEIVTIPWGKSRPIKDVIKYYKGSFVTADNRIATSNDTNRLLNKFLYYWLMSQTKMLDSFYRGSGIQHPSMADVLDMKIPIPPLDTQTEIVRILDTFTELTAELTTELIARKQQYAYYREQLLTFKKDEVETKLLGEVTVYEQPTKYLVTSKEYDDSFKTPVLTAGKTFILGYTDEVQGINKASGKPVIIFDDFTTANKWVDFDFKAKSSAMKMITSVDESKVMQKYIYYWLNILPSELTDGDHKRRWISSFTKKEIPVPPLAEQERIVTILDKFDALTTSLTEGLPREIELRQQQYEYYRDLLLSFPKPEVANHD